MPIPMSSFFIPRNGATWYLVEDTYTKGGLRVVADYNARALIHPANLKAGMLVVTANDRKIWQLAEDLQTWIELRFSSFESNTIAYTHKQSSASDVWTINHGKNLKYFSYTAFDISGKQILPNEMTIVNYITVVLNFATPVAGHCTLVFDTTA